MFTHKPFGQARLQLSEVISALSYALDMVEGQPRGHAARTCMLGMRLAREIGLDEKQCSALFYALLLKDLGCSSNASKVCYLFAADDRDAKRDMKVVDWTRKWDSLKYIGRNVAPAGSLMQKVGAFCGVLAKGPGTAKELVQLRCDRGASIARNLQLPEATALAIHSLDEHWDGHGYPEGLKRDRIPLLARICGLAQTVEVFWQTQGLEAALGMAVDRSGTWFDPELVKALQSIRSDDTFWALMHKPDPAEQVGAFEPAHRVLLAGDATLDRVAVGFGQVIDAKSPWTFCHSAGVAEVAVGIGAVQGFTPRQLQDLRRAALLHDIGKLGISNQILDKPGKLDAAELAQMRKHPQFTHQILSRVHGFESFVELAASHHERLDGRGYHRGTGGRDLSPMVRALVVADMYEALAAKRPYRQDLGAEKVMEILDKESGAGVCPEAVGALKTFLERSNFVPYKIAA